MSSSPTAIEPEIVDFDENGFGLKTNVLFESLKTPSYRAEVSSDVGQGAEKQITLHGQKKLFEDLFKDSPKVDKTGSDFALWWEPERAEGGSRLCMWTKKSWCRPSMTDAPGMFDLEYTLERPGNKTIFGELCVRIEKPSESVQATEATVDDPVIAELLE